MVYTLSCIPTISITLAYKRVPMSDSVGHANHRLYGALRRTLRLSPSHTACINLSIITSTSQWIPPNVNVTTSLICHTDRKEQIMLLLSATLKVGEGIVFFLCPSH